MIPVPYEKVAEQYGLYILLSPGDFVDRNGKTLVINREYGALVHLVEGWKVAMPALEYSLEAAIPPKWGDPKYMDERVEQPAAGLDVTSACYHIVAKLDYLLQNFRIEMDATAEEWQESGPIFHGCSFGSILAAAHRGSTERGGWKEPESPDPGQLSFVRFAAEIREQGFRHLTCHGFARDICRETLEYLCDGCFEKLSAKLFGFCGNVVEQRLEARSKTIGRTLE